MMNENPKILIVEDDESLYDMYRLKFEREGFEVEIAENGFNAILKIQSFVPDIILLDIMMPDMDGFETLRVVREQTSLDTKIVMFTNLDKQEDIDKAFTMGADEYIIKANTTPKEIVEKIVGMLQKPVKKIKCPHCGGIIILE